MDIGADEKADICGDNKAGTRDGNKAGIGGRDDKTSKGSDNIAGIKEQDNDRVIDLGIDNKAGIGRQDIKVGIGEQDKKASIEG